MQQLRGSVGLGGNNRAADVLTVQHALAESGHAPGPFDGICGRRTIGAIEHFQTAFLRRPDGRVDVGGPSWRRLSQPSVARPRPAAAPKASTARASTARPSTAPSAKPVAASASPTRSIPVPAQRSAAVAAARAAPAAAKPPMPTIALAAAPSLQPAEGRSSAYWTTRTPLPHAGTVNRGLASPSSREQVQRFGGMPSANMSQRDQPVTNPELQALIATESVGPFRVTGLRPAIASLRAVLDDVRHDLPDLVALLSSAGMEVNRLQRGSRTAVSNHAWGSAIDLRVGGVLVPFGASYSLKGLDALVPYFNRAGWYWGGGYRSAGRADPMHFELGAAMMATVSR